MSSVVTRHGSVPHSVLVDVLRKQKGEEVELLSDGRSKFGMIGVGFNRGATCCIHPHDFVNVSFALLGLEHEVDGVAYFKEERKEEPVNEMFRSTTSLPKMGVI